MELKITLSGNNVLQVIDEDGQLAEMQLIFPLDTYSEQKFFEHELYVTQVRYVIEKGTHNHFVYRRTVSTSYSVKGKKMDCAVNSNTLVSLNNTILLDIYNSHIADTEFCAAFRKEVLEYFTNHLSE